jgi:hypothetical protein
MGGFEITWVVVVLMLPVIVFIMLIMLSVRLVMRMRCMRSVRMRLGPLPSVKIGCVVCLLIPISFTVLRVLPTGLIEREGEGFTVSLQTWFGKNEFIQVSRGPGLTIGDMVDLKLFEDFRPGMSPEDAAEKFGPPTETRDIRYKGLKGTAYLYSRPSGLVGPIEDKSRSRPVILYPSKSRSNDVILNPSLVTELSALLPSEENLHVLFEFGWDRRSIDLYMNREKIEYMLLWELDPRDLEKAGETAKSGS